VADFSEEYRGYVIYVQVFNTPNGMADIWCRICNPSDAPLSFLTGGMTRLGGGPFEHATAYDVGMYYGMGVIDGYLGKDVS